MRSSWIVLIAVFATVWACLAKSPSKLNPAQAQNNVQKNVLKNLLPDEQNSIKIYQDVAPAVVNVSNVRNVKSGFFFDMDEQQVPAGSGTGFVWNEDGYIVTNYHVVANGDKFYITFQNDNTRYEASIQGVEPSKDTAVLKLGKKRPKKLTPVLVGSSEDLMVGQKAVAIGNPFGFDHTMTVGSISALGRQIDGVGGVKINEMIQTDASINPGNSGGPLLNSRGHLIGMNTLIVSRSGSSAGLGFAVPVDSIKRIVPEIIEHGKVIRPGLGFVPLEERYKEYFGIKKGMVIKSVLKDGGAEKAGLQGITQDRRGYYLGDIILSVDGKPVNNLDEIYHLLENYKVGNTVEVEYLRDEKKRKTKVTLVQL